MKKILFVIAMVMVMAEVGVAQNSLAHWVPKDKTFYTTTWDSIFVTSRDFQFIRVMATIDSGSGYLIVAAQNDTTAANWIEFHPGESPSLPPINNAKWLRVKAKTSNVHARLWIF